MNKWQGRRHFGMVWWAVRQGIIGAGRPADEMFWFLMFNVIALKIQVHWNHWNITRIMVIEVTVLYSLLWVRIHDVFQLPTTLGRISLRFSWTSMPSGVAIVKPWSQRGTGWPHSRTALQLDRKQRDGWCGDGSRLLTQIFHGSIKEVGRVLGTWVFKFWVAMPTYFPRVLFFACVLIPY